MTQITFDAVFTKVNTEKTLKLEEAKQFFVFYAQKHIRKNLASFLFNKKFNMYPLEVKSMVCRQAVKVRTKTKKDVKYKVRKKFYFKLPKNFVVGE